MGFDVEGARKAGYSDDEIAGYLSEKSGFDLKGALGSGYSAREVIDHLSPPRVDLPSGVTPSDAGAGRGRADDPRRTDAGLIQSARSAPMLYGEDPTTGPMQPQSSMPVGQSTASVSVGDQSKAGVIDRAVGEGAQLRDEFFSGVDQGAASVKNVNVAIQANRLIETQARLKEMEGRGRGNSAAARRLRQEVESLQSRLPRTAGIAAEANQTAARGSAMATREAVQRVGQAKTFSEAWERFKEAPYDVIAGVTAQSMPQMLPGLIAATLAGPLQGAIIMGASSGVTEFGSSLGDFARDAGVNTSDAQAVQAFYSDPAKLSEALTYAGKRAGIIGTMDAASGGIASKTLAPAAIRSKIGKQAVNLPAQMGVQAGMGGAGEAGAQLATKGEIDKPGEVFLEMAGELGGAPTEVMAFGREVAAAKRTPSDQAPPSAEQMARDRGFLTPAVPDPVATVQSATSIDGAITAAARAVDAAFDARDSQQAKSEQAVANIARIMGMEIPDVGTAAAVPGMVEPAAGGGAPDGAPGVGAGVGAAGVAGQPVDTGGVGGQPAGGAVSLGAGQPGALNFAQPPGPVRQITVTPAGTLTAIGDPQSLVRLLKSAGVTNVIPATNGITVGKSQASMARQVLDDFVAAPPENFEQDFQQELEREYQADIKAQLLAKRNPQPAKVEKKTQSPLRTMLRTVGIKPELAADITGEKNKVRANNVLPFTFRKNGVQIDELVRIARERGFLTQDEDDIAAGRRLVEMIQADLRGDRQESTETIDDAMRGEQDADIARAAARYGLDISGMEIGQVANAVNRIERRLEKARADGLRREAAAEAKLEREAIQAADRRAAGPDRILDDLDDVPENNATLEDAMRALGFTEQEISDAVAQESRRAQADRAGSGDVVAAAAGPAQGSDRRGESQARQEAGGAESRPQDLLGDAPNASQQEAARLRAEREEQDRRRQQAAPEAGGFMLSGSDRARDVGAAAGQGDLPAGADAAPAPTAAGASPPAQQAELATTDAQRKQAADHAKDLGGRVVWQRGELALIEGFSLLSGDSVYVAAKGDVRTRVDIKSYTGNGYTEAERAELMQARADAVRAADEALARNPDGPFSAGPLVFAEDIPANVQGVVRGWIGLLGLDGARIVVTTPKSGAAMADGLAGKFRRIGKASLSGDNTNGTMQPLGGDDFHIAVRPNVSTLKMLEVLAHELGHIVERRAFAQADPATQQAIREAHAKWLRENGGGRAVDMAQAMRAYRSGQTTGFSDEAKAAEAGAYWRSFGEWFADQVSRWATTQDRPVGVVEQFFKRLADRLRAFFTGERAKFKPDATMAQWLDSLAKDVPPADEVAAQQAEPSAPAPAEPATPEQQEGSVRKGATAASKIEDFGQKLEGARKDYTTTLKDAEAVDIAAEPLSKSWPEPDYDKLLAGGADPYVVAFVHAARDEVPTKPQKGWKLKGWVETVKMLRDMSAKLLSGATSKQTFDTVLARAEFASLRNAVGSRAELYQLVGHAKSLKGVTFSEHHYTIYKGQRNVRKWAVEQKAKATAFGNWPRELAVADTKAEMLEQFKAKMESSSPEGDKAKAAKGQFIIYRKRNQDGAFIGKKIGREYIDLKKLPDVAAARAYLDSNTADLLAALERYKDTPFERNPENRPRVGDDHRNGAAVTPEVFADTFGFRGVQFGNYVEQDRRQSDLNQAFDALMDMAAVLGVPPRALSLNGRLGLAFGARGKGGRNAPAAHYEPGSVVINLTKGNGPGSLGHEWWHAVDNYFGKEFGAGGFATDGARVDRLRAEMQAAFKAVRTATQAPTLRRRAAELDKRRSKPYWNTPLELSARAFESYLIAKLNDQGAANDYLANVVDEKVWNLSEEARATFFGGQAVETYPYPGQAELPDVRAAFDEFFKVVETREDDAGNVAMYARSEPALAGGMPLFGREDRMSGMQGADIAQVRAIVDGIRKTWKGGPSVEVVASYRDLPGRPVPGARGMYIGGKVYVVASSHRAGGNLRQAVAKTLSHEVIAHYGLRKILGADFDRLLTKPLQLAIASGNKPMTALRDQVRRLYVDEDGNFTLSKREEADEIAARAVENAIDAEGNFRPGYSWLKSVWARVAQFLRDRGIDVPFTQAELQGMLVQAQQAVRDGERLAGASTVVVTQQPVLSRRSAEDVAPAEGFWSKIKAGKSFTPQEIADAYARGVRGTVRAFAGFSGEKGGMAAVPGTEHAGWRDEIAGFDGYVTVGVSFADGSLAMGVIPRELYPGRGSALGLADLGEYSLATYAFTPNPDGSYRLDVFDPRRGGRVFDELARRGRLEETGDTDVAGQPYYRAVFDNRYTTSHSLIQEAVRRLGYHLGAVPTVVQIGRDTGSRANPGKEQVRTFTPEFIERRLARAFHGTPHRGIEKFSTDKIGTGEGAQAFGWGLYFASKREIAEHYRNALVKRDPQRLTIDGKRVDPDSILGRAVEDMALIGKDAVLQKLDDNIRFNEKYAPDIARMYRDARGQLEKLSPGRIEAKRGQLYEVEIPEDSEMLLWDKPMSEQPALSVSKVFNQGWQHALYRVNGSKDVRDFTGAELYRALSVQMGGDRAASDALASLGIKGIKYLDGVSRNKSLRDVKREFLSELPEDADFDEVMDLIGSGTFSPKNEAILKALADNDWLGFDYPAQAISAALSGQLGNYDASPTLVQAVADAQDDGTYNYVIFSGDDVAIQAALYARGEDQTNTPAFRKWSSLLGTSGLADLVETMSDKTVVDRLQRDAKSLANLLERQTGGSQGGSLVDGPSAMVRHVLNVSDNPEVLRAIVSAIPVDMVDLLRRKKLSPETLLRDKSMLEDVLAVDRGPNVPLDINEALAVVRVVARAAAELAADLAGGALKSRAAVGANAGDSVFGTHARSVTETESFSKWFGDSKVVDAEGRPLMVYHGTTADLSAFDLAFSGSDGVAYDRPAIFATDDARLASDYARNKRNRSIADAGRAFQRFKNENPGVYDEEYERLFEAYKASGRKEGWDIGGGANVLPLYLSIQNPLEVDGGGQRFMQVMPDAVKQATEQGRDGVIVRNVIDHASPASEYPATVYVAFHPEQIKSAIGNNGEFDPANPDIRYARGDDGLSATIEASNLIADFRAEFGSKPPSGMSQDEFWAWSDRRSAAEEKMVQQVTDIAKQADNALVLPLRYNPKTLVALHPDTRKAGALRITYFIADTFEPSGHEEYSKPEQAAAAWAGLVDPNGERPLFALASNEDLDADEAPAPRSRWLDDAGRLRFLPGTVVYDLLGKAATPLLNRAYLKTQSKPLRRAIREMKLTVQKAQDTAEEIGREVVKLTDAEREMVSDIIEKELATGVIPPEHAVKLAATMNEVLGKQSDELVALGMLAPDTAEQWRGKYLARYYKDKLGARVQSAWDKAISTFGAKPMRGLRGNHFKGRGLFEVIPEAELPAWEANGWEVRDPDYQEGITKDGTVRVWRDFTRAEREKMGEIRDAGFRFVMGYMETQKDIALGRMFQAIAADPELSSKYQTEELSEQVPDGTIAGTGVKKYGKLAGRWVSKETISHLSQIEESQSEAFKMYRKAMGLWKEGKALAIDTPIPTPTGWKTMGDVQEGDTVFDEQGKPCRVTYATGVQMNRECYEVEFSDGCKIVADAEHLWFTVYHMKGSVKTTKQILDTLKERTRGDNNHSVPVAGALQTAEVELPIHPYALGVWLGDGDTDSARMTAGSADADEMIAHLNSVGVFAGARHQDPRTSAQTFQIRLEKIGCLRGHPPEAYRANGCGQCDTERQRARRLGHDMAPATNGQLSRRLRDAGLFGNKSIPAAYLRASVHQRMELLRGLMDTDGTISDRGQVSFTTTLPALRDGFMELTRSLGLKPVCSVRESFRLGKRHRDAYTIKFMAYADKPVFKLARKAARLLPRPETRQRSGTRQIVAIRPVPSVPVKCIQVDSESRLYLAGASMIPTHNTSLNPVAHANNIVSNITMAHFAGVSYWDVHKYAKAMRDFAMKSDSVKEAKDAGLFLGTVSDAELMNVLPEDLKAIVRQQEGALTKVGSNAFNAMTWFLRRPMGAAYQAEDTFFRYLIWKDARDQGMSAEDAVDYSLRYIFAYDDLPLRARQIRDFMIPFFAYTYKAIPALLHTAANYPWRFAAPAAVMWGINAAAYAIAVGDDDDDWIERLQKYLTDPAYREKARAKEKMEREYLPEWMKGETIMNTPKAIRLGMDEVTKLPLFIDVYRMVPGGDMLDMNNNAGGTPWLQPFTPNHPLLTTYMAMFGNRDGWTGKDVVDKTDDSTEAAQKRLGWMWRQTAPALAYGNYHFERTMQALAQATGKPVQWAPEFMGGMEATGVGKDGLPVQPKYAAMQTFGLKVRPIDVEMGEIYDSAAKNKLIREIDAEMRRLGRLNAKGAVSDAAFDREAEKANVKRDRLNDGLTIDGKPKN